MMGEPCVFMRRKESDAKWWVLYHSQSILHYTFHGPHYKTEFDTVRDDSLKQERKRATQMYFV
ncbi:hypothetical protein [Bartonella sp. AU55XJBT]|uniref:hypothetical protein n=1 Tax=Bartonella sp. AU55XJBT TaxID=3019091 RepID=UPI002360B7D8|nr:hypothetical protein [Bartonella sp. AU55XJBT]